MVIVKSIGSISILFLYGIKNAQAAFTALKLQAMEADMRQDDIMILKEIQKNTQMAMTAIDTLLDKTTDDEFTMKLSRQSIGYARIHNDAVEQLIEQQSGTYRGNQITDMMLKGSIHMNTLLDISTSHMAEMMIQGSNRGFTNVYKTVKHNTLAQDRAVELAQEFMDFETKSIEQMKEYL